MSNVVISNHRNKDWESIDMESDINDISNYFKNYPKKKYDESQKITVNGIDRYILMKGLKSCKKNPKIIHQLVSLNKKDTIEYKLKNLKDRMNPQIFSKTICLFHNPPYVNK